MNQFKIEKGKEVRIGDFVCPSDDLLRYSYHLATEKDIQNSADVHQIVELGDDGCSAEVVPVECTLKGISQ